MPLFHITLREHTYTGRFYNDVAEAGSFAEALRPGFGPGLREAGGYVMVFASSAGAGNGAGG
jgi:hypothetical protein